MSKVFLLGANQAYDKDTATVAVNQIVQMQGYDYDRFAVVSLDQTQFGIYYQLVNLRTHEYRSTQIIRPLSQKFGIGYYFDAEAPEFMDAMEVMILRTKAEELKVAQERERREHNAGVERLREIGAARLEKLMPRDIKGVVYAEYRNNESDSQTDYFGYSVGRIVILGFSHSERNNFSEMRKYAAHFPETAHLAEYDPEKEHRENYTGGGGYYLGTHRCAGWVIKKNVYRTREGQISEFAVAAGNEDNIRLGAPAADTPRTAVPANAAGVRIVDYSDKAIAVIGDTKPIKEALSALGGRFNFRLNHEGQTVCGWIFPKTKADEVRAALTI